MAEVREYRIWDGTLPMTDSLLIIAGVLLGAPLLLGVIGAICAFGVYPPEPQDE